MAKPTWDDDICKRFSAAFRAAYGPGHARKFHIAPLHGRYRIWKRQGLKFADHNRRDMMRRIERLEARPQANG